MALYPITWGKGVNKDMPAAGLPDGFASDVSNFRARKGYAETFEGAYAVDTLPVATFWVAPYATTSTRFLIAAGTQKVYAREAAATEITRYTDGVEITSITFVGTTATVTTATAHGRSTGNNVTHYEAFPLEYNATGNITVTGPTTYTYVMASAPATNATTVGAYSYNVTSDFSSAGRWSGAPLNGLMFMNNAVDGLYFWDGDTSKRLRKVPNSYVADCSRTFKFYVIQLAPTISGVKYPQRVLWSSAAAPKSVPSAFAPSVTNDARSQELSETPGQVIDCMPMGDVNVVFKSDSIYVQQYVGGNDVFRFSRIQGTDGLLTRGCVVSTPKGLVFMSQKKDVRLFSGGQSVSLAEGRIKDWLFQVIGAGEGFGGSDKTNTTFLAVNAPKSEVWVVFAKLGATNNACAAVWNWEDDTWGIFDFDTSAYINYACSGPWPSAFKYLNTTVFSGEDLLIATTGSGGERFGIVKSDSGNYMGSSFTGTLARAGITCGNPNTMKALQRSRWHFVTSGTPPPVLVSHGSGKFATTAPTYETAVDYVVGTDNFADKRSTAGRFLAVSLVTPSGRQMRINAGEIDVTTMGTR